MNDTFYSDTKNSDGSIREQRVVSGFTRIKISGDATLQVVQGDREWLIVQADEELMPHVTTEVIDGTLILKLADDNSHNFFRRTVHFFVGCKTLSAVGLSGSTAVKIPALNTQEFVCGASGSAYMEIGVLEAQKLTVKASGSATMLVGGHVDEQLLHCSGAMNYQAASLGSKRTQIEVSGASEMTLWVEELLDVRSASGACKVRYYGNPQVKHTPNFMTKLVALGQPVPQP